MTNPKRSSDSDPYDDEKYARQMVEHNPRNFKYCSARLQDDEAFATWAVEKLPRNFASCSERLRDDEEFARWAIEKDEWNFVDCSPRLRDDPVFFAYVDLVTAEKTGATFVPPNSLRDIFTLSQMMGDGENTREFREDFWSIAKGQQSAISVPAQTPIQVSIDSLSI